MATGITKNTSIIGVESESTEGTYVAPSAATSYLQPLADGFELTPAREKIDRTILTNSIGKATPRLGIKSSTASLPVEFRASGVEGGDVDFGLLLKGALGATRSISTTTTTKNSGNTGSVLQIQDADISKFNVYDIILVKESGGHHPCVITAKDSTGGAANITISPSKASGSFSNSVVISKSTMYYTANSGHPALSLSYYWANEIVQKAIGCKVTSMALDNFATGQVASLNFGLEGLGYGEANGAAPHTPSYDSGIPPIILGATVYRDGTAIDINQFGLNVANTLSFLTATANANGRSSSRVTQRTITGSLNPYKDDTTTTYHDAFNNGTEFALFIKAYNPSAVSGEITMGSCIGIYLPKCIATETKVADLNGILIDQIAFQAVRGSDGSSEEMYLGLI
jgi:hypothetical protein